MMNKIYMDHSATTPVDSHVVDTMLPYLREQYGNPSSIHSFGRATKIAIEEAREKIAAILNARPNEIFFTSGGTESDNLAIKGTALQLQDKGKHIITSQTEHHAVLRTCQFLETIGYRVTYLKPDSHGQIHPGDVESAIDNETILISIMHANNETGTINPIDEIGQIARENNIFFHSDAVQSFGKLDIKLNELPIDLLTITSHKIYGPKGIGALFVRNGVKLMKQLHGGEHERGLRACTENVAGMVGFAKAAELMIQNHEQNTHHIQNLSDTLIKGIVESIDRVHFNGHPEHRLPNVVNISFEGVEGESLLMGLDLRGIAVSSGSACTSGSIEPSHVLLAMNVSSQLAQASVRFSLGRKNTIEEVEYVVGKTKEIVNRLRSFSPFS